MRKVRLEEYGAPLLGGSKALLVTASDTGQRIFCHMREEGDQACFNHCSAFRVQDGHVYCLALSNAFVPAFAIGELVEDGAK